MRSIKAKLGVLVAVSVSVSALVVWYGLVNLGWPPRYILTERGVGYRLAKA
jgi:hypothetical protein